MGRIIYFDTVHSHNFPWAQVASGYWGRYPNPNSKHVFTEDFIDVQVQPDGRLYTKRFIGKTNKLPSWGEHFFKTRFVPLTEETFVDHRARTLTTYTRNIGGLRYFMGVTERVIFKPDPENPKKTLVEKTAFIESDMFGFRSPIKKYGIDRFKKNCVAATEGFDWVLRRKFGGAAALESRSPKEEPRIPASSSFTRVQAEENGRHQKQ